MKYHRYSIVFQYDVEVEDDCGNTLSMTVFRSNKSVKLILNGDLKPNVLPQKLHYTDTVFDMMYEVISVLRYININGGFNMIGWCKKV